MTAQTLTRPSLRTRSAGPRHAAPSVEVVVPVFNEQAALERSIREQIYTLPDDTRLLPGHGPATTVGDEKRTNPFVNDL